MGLEEGGFDFGEPDLELLFFDGGGVAVVLDGGEGSEEGDVVGDFFGYLLRCGGGCGCGGGCFFRGSCVHG